MPSGENLLVALDCGFSRSGGLGFRVLDFEFVQVFDSGVGFPVWLRPQAALRSAR
jgi:hypothetical protein